MPKILNLPKKKPKYPLIEIMGPIDCGKSYIASLVAKRLGATLITLPNLDPTSLTGRALLSCLSQMPQALEKQLDWWAHIYAAHLIEQKERIEAANEIGPVVIINYVLAFRSWMNDINLSTWTRDLPQSTIGFVLTQQYIDNSLKPVFDFSTEFRRKVSRSLNQPGDKKIKKIKVPYDKPAPMINNAAITITTHLNKIYKLPVDERELWSQK